MLEEQVARAHPGQTAGLKANAALPLGLRHGGDTDSKAREVGRRERANAGPDGPDAREIGDTFKAKP